MTKLAEPTGGGENSWSLREMRDRLDQIVRAAEEGYAQRIMVDGRDAAILISVGEWLRLRGIRTGQALVDAMQACPYPDFELAPSVISPVRDVEL